MTEKIPTDELLELMQTAPAGAIERLAGLVDPVIKARNERRDEASKQFVRALTETSNEIYKRTIRNPANYIRVSSKHAKELGLVEETE